MRSWSVVLSVLALGISACGSSGGGLSPEQLAAPGPHGIGYRIMTVSYQPPLATEPRSMIVHVWYPAEAAEGERPLYVLRKSEAATLDAPPLELGPRPVVLFSHGHQAYAAVMSALMEHLASHGYIAIAPTHTGNTFIDGDNRETDIYYLRSLDVRAALDHVLALQGDPLSGRLSDRIAMSGHSFGGYTTMALGGASFPVDALDAACASGQASRGYCSSLTDDKRAIFRAGLADPRFSALLSFDPGDFELFGAGGVAAVDRPVLHVVAERSGNPPGDPARDAYWSALTGADDLRLLLLGGDHNDFTDSCGAGVTIRCSELPAAEVMRPLRMFALAFLEQHLMGRGDASALAPNALYELTKR